MLKKNYDLLKRKLQKFKSAVKDRTEAYEIEREQRLEMEDLLCTEKMLRVNERERWEALLLKHHVALPCLCD